MAQSPTDPPLVIQDGANSGDAEIEPLAPSDPNDPSKPAHFDYITENIYISPSLQTSKDRKRSKRMVCECQFDAETDEPEEACGETCLNRLLMIECGSRCPCGEYCTNKKFQRAEYAKVEVFKTDKKGWGLRALEPIAAGTFVMEYCGEVCTPKDFEERKLQYIKDKRRHYYFMSLTTDEILDATRKGNLSRYINHSCNPNSETQKWTVNGKLRIGFFSLKDIQENDELTFDYKFERFGDVAQKCYCGSANCRGYLGQTKQTPATLKVMTLDRELGSPRSPSSSRRRPRQRIQSDADSAFEKDLYDIVGSSWRLKNNTQVLGFCRLMLQAESPTQRVMLLQVLQATDDTYTKKFIGFHGLRLLWSWMVDSSDLDSSEWLQFRMQVLQTLDHLPIANKNQLDDNKILPVVRRWAEHGRNHGNKPSSEEESVSSQQQPSSSDEQLEGTVVTEADSVCEPAPDPEPEAEPEQDVANMEVGGATEASITTEEELRESEEKEGEGEGEGSCQAEVEAREADSATISTEPEAAAEESEEVGVVVKGEDDVIIEEGEGPGSCEAEAREQSGSEQSQDEGQSSEASGKLVTAAEELLKKWESLKEVFRIPKRTPQHKKASPEPQSSLAEEESNKETEDMDDEEVFPPSSRRSRHLNREHHSSSRHSSPHERRSDRQSDRTPDRTWSRYRKGLLPTPKRSPLTSSPSQRIAAAAATTIPMTPPITTPPINPALSYPLPPSTVAGFAAGSHAPHTYTTNFTATAPVQNTVIVQQPGQSVYVQQQVFQDGLKTTILPTQYAPPTQRPPSQQPAAQQYVQLNPTHLPSLPPLPTAPTAATTYTQLTQQTGGGAGIIQNPVPIPTAVVPPTGFVAAPTPTAAIATNNMTTLQPQYYQQTQQQQQVFLQSSVSSSLITGTSLLPQQPQQQTPSTADANPLALAPLPPPPPEEEKDLPLNWKTARDTNGKIYYYHSITRKTQWERPTDKDAEGTITMDLGTPEPESESEGETSSKIAPRGPRTPPDYSEGEERMPYTPEGSPPPRTTPKRYKGPRTPSPTHPRHKRRKSKLKYKRRNRSRSLKVKGPRTPSPPPSGRSSVQSHSLPKSSHSPSPHHKDEDHASSGVATSPKQDPLPTLNSPKDLLEENENKSILEEKSSTVVAECSESQVEKSGSNDNSPIPKPDSPKLHSPLPIPISQHSTPTASHSPPHSSSQEHSPLDLSFTSDPGGAEQQEPAPPPRKKHRGEGKVKSKASKAKEEYRHKLSKVVTHCLDQHRKSDCKYGRITCADDFKYLARRLTYGLAEKEFHRKGGARLDLTDSVKAKVKDYIRQYMKKFGSVYYRTSSP